ncbi:alpha-(1-_3)-arabinofuranosyltransferase family protein [Nocardioides sp. W7]|uniref:alpha-(1->3)-arabinofuranosyltransferase domain-containing protein n=1 Tax=Nocardioides sp. W7 TaxID=2931390 RepID=UPI001FD2F378|nr:alpha-(1->3)-arabinofuranosyltransferase family protein [Nocardioides sp. W7]
MERRHAALRSASTLATVRPHRVRWTPSGIAALALYLGFVLVSLAQQVGRTTYDTRAELTERPGSFLREAFSLWHPESNFGEFQNQAYGYLFPQGAWFAVTDTLGLADWVSQRLWTALILIVACEGARRVARVLDLPGAAALIAGLAFAFSPRLLGTVPVLTGESLPGAVMPWVLLPLLLLFRGRLDRGRALLMSAAAIVCMGGVNAVENIGALPLVLVLLVWGVRRRLVSRGFAAAWAGAAMLASFWWVLPLLVLAGHAPPFYEYVESAANTTAIIGWSESVRGNSHWVAYLITGDQSWWPAAHALVAERGLVLVTAVISALGLYGLARMEHGVRAPLLLSAVLGLAALTIAHGGWPGSPLSGVFRTLLDNQLQIFRNVHKIDPIVRLPLALGFGHAVVLGMRAITTRWPRTEPARPLLLLLPVVLVLSLGQPFLANNSRTPGWTEISDPWQQAQRYLVDHQGSGQTLILPGSGFAQQEWGWTLDEPLLVLGGVNRVVRSQVPLVPGQSIRFLTALDQLATTGKATPKLGDQLARAGIGHVVIRRDLLRRFTGSPHPGGAAVSLANGGLTSVARFGTDGEGGPAVEVLAVDEQLPALRATPVDDVLTVRGAPESVLAVQDNGLVEPGQATVLEGEPGWDREADIVTDGDQRRERAFGVNDESVSAVLGPDDEWRTERAAHDFPTVDGARQVVATYDGLRSLTASSAQGYADNFGPVVPQGGPYSAIDGDRQTRWVSSYASDPTEQWVRLDFDGLRSVGRVSVLPVVDDDAVVPVRELEIRAGDQVRTVRGNASGAPSVVEFDRSRVDHVEVRITRAATREKRARVGLREITIAGLTPKRSLQVPGEVGRGAAFVFTTGAERRACTLTVGVPDCDASRIRAAEERTGLDRTFTTSGYSNPRLQGWVVARATNETARLLEPLGDDQVVGASSVYGFDPKVSSRFAYDGQSTTAWASSPQDSSPTLLFRWKKRQRISRVTVLGDDTGGVPLRAVVSSLRRSVEVPLDGTGLELNPPFSARQLRVEFIPRPGTDRVVVPEIAFAGADVQRPFLADAPTGAQCGLGPNIEIDGRTVPTRVDGTMADLVNGTPLRFESCALEDAKERPLLEPGEHRLRAVPNAEFAVIQVAGVPERQLVVDTGRDVDIDTWGAGRRTAEVAAGPESLLAVPENFNDGWRAEVDGERLRPIRVDGWQQGWVLPEGGPVTVELTYAPQRVYAVLLPLGLVVSGLILLGGLLSALSLLWRRSRREPDNWDLLTPQRAGGRAITLTAVVSLLVLGPAAALGLVLVVGASLVVARPGVLGRWGAHWTGRFVPAWAALAVIGSAVLDVTAGPSWTGPLADALAALGVGLVCGLMLSTPRREARRRWA